MPTGLLAEIRAITAWPMRRGRIDATVILDLPPGGSEAAVGGGRGGGRKGGGGRGGGAGRRASLPPRRGCRGLNVADPPVRTLARPRSRAG